MKQRTIRQLLCRIKAAGAEIQYWEPDHGLMRVRRADGSVAWGAGSDFSSALISAADAVERPASPQEPGAH